MITTLGNIKPGAFAEIAKAEPDIQALIAERIEAGDIVTAAEVKDIRPKPKNLTISISASRPPKPQIPSRTTVLHTWG